MKGGEEMLDIELQQQLIELIKEQVHPDFLILFGSFATGKAHEQSDVDLAYFSDKHLSPYERFILAGDLAQVCGREVDLVDIKDIDTIFAMQIFADGIPIFIADENEFVRQRMRAYSMYVTLNEQRTPIIEKIKERGSVFGDE